MNEIFDRIDGDFEELEEVHKKERADFIHSLKNYPVRQGILKLLEESNLSVERRDENTVVVGLNKRIQACIDSSGKVNLYWGGVYVMDVEDDKRFKQIYAHLRKIYEEK